MALHLAVSVLLTREAGWRAMWETRADALLLGGGTSALGSLSEGSGRNVPVTPPTLLEMKGVREQF